MIILASIFSFLFGGCVIFCAISNDIEKAESLEQLKKDYVCERKEK